MNDNNDDAAMDDNDEEAAMDDDDDDAAMGEYHEEASIDDNNDDAATGDNHEEASQNDKVDEDMANMDDTHIHDDASRDDDDDKPKDLFWPALEPLDAPPSALTLLISTCRAVLDFHTSNFYTLPFYYCGHAVSKTDSLSSQALLLPLLVSFDCHNREFNRKWIQILF